MKIAAALVLAPGQPFEMGEIELDAPRPNEVLVRIAGVGLCHTDLVTQQGYFPMKLPAVFGHEGAGIVEQVGKEVRKVQPGDRVAMTFMSCGHCPSCEVHAPAYCHSFSSRNYGNGTRGDGSATLRNTHGGVSGGFFGQSSFASHALVSERNLVKVPQGVPLELAGALDCGVQTGAGAVMLSMACRKGSTCTATATMRCSKGWPTFRATSWSARDWTRAASWARSRTGASTSECAASSTRRVAAG